MLSLIGAVHVVAGVLASQHLTRSLLQSPFLASHPIRSEMLRFIMKQSKESEEQQRQQRTTANGSYELKEPLPVLDHMSMRYALFWKNDLCWHMYL